MAFKGTPKEPGLQEGDYLRKPRALPAPPMLILPEEKNSFAFHVGFRSTKACHQETMPLKELQMQQKTGKEKCSGLETYSRRISLRPEL